MNRLIPALAAACFVLAAAPSFAQTPQGGGKPQMSEQQRHEMRAKMKAAHEACKDKPDKRACMMEQRCAKAPDPAKCQAEGKERMQQHTRRMDERQKAHEACTGKRGEELMKCLHEQKRQHKPEGRK